MSPRCACSFVALLEFDAGTIFPRLTSGQAVPIDDYVALHSPIPRKIDALPTDLHRTRPYLLTRQHTQPRIVFIVVPLKTVYRASKLNHCLSTLIAS